MFGGTYCLHFHLNILRFKATVALRNDCNFLPDYTRSRSRRFCSLQSPQTEYKMLLILFA